MNERICIADKKPEVKSQNPVPQIRRKTESFQSINSPVDRILVLQRTIGNQAIGKLIKSGALQAKLRIGQPGDVYEQEADRVAEQVMRMPDVSSVKDVSIQRKCPKCLKGFTGLLGWDKKDEKLQTKETPDKTPEVTPQIEANIQALKGGGQPLSESMRAFFEPRFGQDFSQVRLHTDTLASRSAEAINALAYTTGNNVVFRQGRYAPESYSGKLLLAHELTHVMQQDRVVHPWTPLQTVPTARAKVHTDQAGTVDRNAARLEKESPLPVTALVTGANTSIQCFHHTSSCKPSDLSGIVWPGDSAMRQMVAKAIRVLSAKPINPLVTALFPKYFMTATPPIAAILAVFKAVQAVITGNDYWYECEHECGSEEAAFVRDRLRYIGMNPNLHVCINHMSGYSLPCNASLILHELTHYAAHLDDEAKGCGTCSTAGCPASLSPSDALDNTYSYADFAYELDSVPV